MFEKLDMQNIECRILEDVNVQCERDQLDISEIYVKIAL